MRTGSQFGLHTEPRDHNSAPADSVATEESRGGLCTNSFPSGSCGQTLTVSWSFRTQSPVGTVGREKSAVERSKLCLWETGGFTRPTRGWDALPPLQTVGRVNRMDEAKAPPQLLSALNTHVRTRIYTHHLPPATPGARGQASQALTWCLKGYTLPPNGTHLPFPASDNIGRGEENGAPGCLQGAPSLPNRAERRGSPATPCGTLPAAHPLEFHPPPPTLGPCHPLYPGQVSAGKGTCQDLHLAGVFLPRCQPPVLRLTCLLPARQLSGWDLSVHLPHSPLLRKWEGAEEVLQRRAPGPRLGVKGTQEEGRVQSRSALCKGDPALLPRGRGFGTTD